MRKSERRGNNKLDARLKLLKKEQRRLASEIMSLSKDAGKNVSSSAKRVSSAGRRKTREAKSGRSGVGVEMRSYLTTGSFGGRRTLRRERSIQRNRAIFMGALAITAIYSFFRWCW